MSLLKQFQAAGVAFFFKQWGGFDKKAAGRLLNGRIYGEYPEIIMAEIAPAKERGQMVKEIETIIVKNKWPSYQAEAAFDINKKRLALEMVSF